MFPLRTHLFSSQIEFSRSFLILTIASPGKFVSILPSLCAASEAIVAQKCGIRTPAVLVFLIFWQRNDQQSLWCSLICCYQSQKVQHRRTEKFQENCHRPAYFSLKKTSIHLKPYQNCCFDICMEKVVGVPHPYFWGTNPSIIEIPIS